MAQNSVEFVATTADLLKSILPLRQIKLLDGEQLDSNELIVKYGDAGAKHTMRVRYITFEDNSLVLVVS